jgi:hypothetical protein
MLAGKRVKHLREEICLEIATSQSVAHPNIVPLTKRAHRETRRTNAHNHSDEERIELRHEPKNGYHTHKIATPQRTIQTPRTSKQLYLVPCSALSPNRGRFRQRQAAAEGCNTLLRCVYHRITSELLVHHGRCKRPESDLRRRQSSTTKHLQTNVEHDREWVANVDQHSV